MTSDVGLLQLLHLGVQVSERKGHGPQRFPDPLGKRYLIQSQITGGLYFCDRLKPSIKRDRLVMGRNNLPGQGSEVTDGRGTHITGGFNRDDAFQDVVTVSSSD